MRQVTKIECPKCSNIMKVGKRSSGKSKFTCCSCKQEYVFTPERLQNPEELKKTIFVYSERTDYVVRLGNKKSSRRSQRNLEVQ